ncbi:uncharacterized protein EI97DRAFT_428905 [Westerdykella ornata]|uniref:DUF7707 domain-containing protein n=1 Tax=Westerdykella ornata TaxID=318751 RepID=A0A6A6K0D4_WESOR|nr:uncharacterized protein EI97DRAFT_428905 [Westerdykella ornata]KAF2280809.1 hypothetical protein EI97DRAFT_428905 [Westerdykella ornata]
MLLSSLLFVASTLSLAAAQNESSSLPPGMQPCCQVDPNVIPQDLRNSWCLAQRNTCPELCGGIGQLAPKGQSCDTNTLEWTCECRNGTKPDVAAYQQTVPAQMCRFWFDQCINATNENLEYQVECQNQRDQKCGNLTTDASKHTSSSASPTASATGTGSGGQESPSTTGEAPASTSSPGAASTLTVARDYGTVLLAGGIAAIFGLAL